MTAIRCPRNAGSGLLTRWFDWDGRGGWRRRVSPGSLIGKRCAPILRSVRDAGFEAFTLDDEGFVVHQHQRVGRLERGAELLHPKVTTHDSHSGPSWSSAPELGDLGEGARRRIERRLQAWARDLVEDLLAPLRALEAQPLGGQARGLVYQLVQGLGTIARADARAQLGALRPDDRERLLDGGVELGHAVVHMPALLSARALRARAALLRAWLGPARPVPVLSPAAASVPVEGDKIGRAHV